jgi:TonB family protein
MSTPLWLSNLASYSVQLALVVLACGVTARALRAVEPRSMLRYWRAVLLLSLLLPALQPWTPARPRARVSEAGVLEGAVPPPAAPLVAWPAWVASAWALGALARMSWLALGLLRLRQYRRRARAVELEEARSLARRLGVAASVAVSSELEMPVTFGGRRPTILLPVRLLASAVERQRAVLCHEMLHVRRGDWRATLGEECVRALLWFHPALHWLLRRIRLTREQLVDREVVALTGNREAYLEALLDAARAGVRLQPVAALLPRANHLRERIDLLLEEVTMSTRRMLTIVGACGFALVLSSALAVRAFPLSAPADSAERKAMPLHGVAGGVAGGVQDDKEKPPPPHKPPRKIVYKVAPAFPEGAKKVRSREDVVLELSIEKSGEVSDVKVVKGHPSFNESAVEAVKQWKFEPSEQSPAMATITIRFVPPPPPPPPQPAKSVK